MQNSTSVSNFLKKRHNLPRWVKIAGRIVLGAILFIIVAYLGLAFYINTNKKEILAKVSDNINENLNGKFTAESMEPTFLKGFPNISLRLNNVEVKDNLWKNHQHTLLKSSDFNISINAFAFLRGTVEIKKIQISDASIYLYEDASGYSNTSIFKTKKEKKEANEGSSSFAEIKAFELDNVNFVSDNKRRNKLFNFQINNLRGRIDFVSEGWNADLKLDAFAKSFAFNTKHGSFMKDKALKGKLQVAFNNEKETLTILPNDLQIGENDFNVGAKFNVGKTNSGFSINIKVYEILWKQASNLLSNNISFQLNRFDLEQPIAVTCDIVGDLNAEGDPLIYVKATVKNNRLHVPDGIVDNCNFNGIFTNEYKKGKGFTDPNSAVMLYDFKGEYQQMPFVMDSAVINDLEKPFASGVFKANFPLVKMNNAINDDLLKFSDGNAKVELKFRADIVNLEITKPKFSGLVNIENGDVNYVPRNVRFKNTNVALEFTESDLLIKNIRLQSGKSVVLMEGDIQNFLNLYYTDPEKIVLNWKVRSPQMHMAEFMSFLGSRKTKRIARKNSSKSNISDNLNFLFEKSNVAMNVKIDNFYYNKFTATNVNANILLSESGIFIKDAIVNHAGGTVKLSGKMTQGNQRNQFSLNTTVNNVSIQKFFHAFNNFGMETMSSKNLRGFLFSKANLSGIVTNEGKMIPNSMHGNIAFDLKKGALVGFDPIKSVGKFAFPFRNLDTITFTNLNGRFDVKGEKIEIYPMKINSSVLNMDLAGIYSFGKGTNIALDVPLRNPKKDKDITDEELLEERRNKGIVLHLLASDDEDGKVKIKLVSKKTRNNALE